MEQGNKKSKLKIIIPVIIAIIVIAVVGIVVLISNKKEKVYKIGETITTEDWEITLTDVQYGKQSSKSLSHEDCLLPIDNSTITAPAYDKSTSGNTFVIITYNIKFLGKTNTNLTPGFTLDYDNGYIIENNSNLLPSFYIRNSLEEGAMIGNSYQSLWNIVNNSYEFKPLSNELKIREYIEIPDNVANDTEKPLILVKGLRKSGSIMVNSGGFVKYNIRNVET